jgi:hypothetical protein
VAFAAHGAPLVFASRQLPKVMSASKRLPVIVDVRWTTLGRRAVASRCSPAKHSVSSASAWDDCSALAVSVLQGEDPHPMPSYHWGETAVVLIYSLGYTLSFMRMPTGGAIPLGLWPWA